MQLIVHHWCCISRVCCRGEFDFSICYLLSSLHVWHWTPALLWPKVSEVISVTQSLFHNGTLRFKVGLFIKIPLDNLKEKRYRNRKFDHYRFPYCKPCILHPLLFMQETLCEVRAKISSNNFIHQLCVETQDTERGISRLRDYLKWYCQILKCHLNMFVD